MIVFPISNFGGGFTAEYQAVYDSFTTPPSGSVARAQDAMLKSIINGGVWAKLDLFYLFAQSTNGDGEALVNWKQPTGGTVLNGTDPCENAGGANGYTTFSAVGNDGFDVTSNGVALHIAGTKDEIVMTSGKTYLVTFDLTLNSGNLPGGVRLASGLGSTARSNTVVPTAGSNEALLVANADDTGVFQIWNSSTTTDYEIRNIEVKEWTNATAYNDPTFTALEGFTGDGSTTYIDCNWNPTTANKFSLTSASGGVYIRNDVAENKYVFGVWDGVNGFNLSPQWSDNNSYFRANSSGSGTGTPGSSQGLFIVNKLVSADNDLYRNGSRIADDSDVGTSVVDYNMYVLAQNGSGSPLQEATNQVSLFFCGQGLSSTEISDITNAVETYMDSNGKGVIS